MAYASLLLLMMVLLMGPSVVPGTRGGKKPPPAPHFLHQQKSECHFSNGMGVGGQEQLQVRYLDRFIYDQQEFVRFDSASGVFEAVSTVGEPDAQLWNSQKEILQYQRAGVNRCRYNYDILGPFSHQRRIPPTISISPTKEDPLSPHTLLLCTAASFYPLEIEMKWLKNGQEQKEGVLYREELHNGDWTYQTQVMLDTKPEHGDVYTCRVEHASLEVPITIQWEPWRSDSARSKVWTGAVGGMLGVAFVAMGLSLYLKSKKAPPIQTPAALIS